MLRYIPGFAASFMLLGLLAATVFAQPAAGVTPGGPSGEDAESNGGEDAAPLAMEGYCVVSLANGKGWVKGDKAFSTTYDGSAYLFRGAGQLDMFKANPGKYTPALGGHCVVTFVDMAGTLKPGDIRFAARYKSRYYLTDSQEHLKTFSMNPAKYAAAAAMAESPVVLDGYCAVCIHDLRKWVKGSEDHLVLYDGKKYLFPGEAQKATFQQDPAKYAPAMGGNCVVSQQKLTERTPGSILHTAFYKNRLFLFAGAQERTVFSVNPKKFADVDLALEGNDPVAAAMGATTPGLASITTLHRGMRYQFATEANREKFLADPGQFAR